MNSFERALVLKAGYDNGWEVVLVESPERVVLASALHRARAQIETSSSGNGWMVGFQPHAICRELRRDLWNHALAQEQFEAGTESELGRLMNQAARLARALPDEPWVRFEDAVTKELSIHPPTTTEVERIVRQRVGQDIYRASLMDYWGGACAVTGIEVPELLRASHAKPWAECETDAERLNVFNGFLLTAHLDALFDRHLMSFDDGGEALFSPKIDGSLRVKLAVSADVRIRWIRDEHLPFLRYHRAAFEQLCRRPAPIPSIM